MLLKLVFLSLYICYVHAERNNETCGCYALGTFSSVDSESLCNEKTLQCQCLPNVTGINCDQCAKDHYDIFSGRGCSQCECSKSGSVKTQCDSITGKCTCKGAYTGPRCDKCILNTYKDKHSCINCNCNINGSKNLQCDRNGQCACKENVEGKQCERCKENTHNLEEGCKPCPSCYKLIQDENKIFAQNLHTADVNLRIIEYNMSSIILDFENFVTEIQSLNSKVEALYNTDTLIIPSNVEELFLDIEKQVNTFQKDVDAALIEIKGFDGDNNALKEVELLFQETNSLLQTGEKELEDAKVRSAQLGSSNKTITDIAKTSKAVLETITKKSEELTRYAEDIQNVTNDVCGSAEAFEIKQKQIQVDANTLSSELSETVNGTMSIKSYIKSFSSEVKKTYSEALSLNQKATNVTLIEDNEILTETAIIKFDYFYAEGKIQDVNNTTAELEESLQSTERYVNKVKNRQSIVESEFKLLQPLDKDANSAIEDTKELFSKATIYLNSVNELQNLHQPVQELLKGVPNIQEKIEAVRDNYKETQQIFVEALDIIETNKKLTKKIDVVLSDIKGNKGTILTHAKSVEKIEEEEEEASGRLVDLQIEFKNVKHELHKLKTVKSKTEEKVQQIKDYMTVLDAIPLDEEGLNGVENEVKTLEDVYNSIDDIQKEKKLLEKEVENIKQILESLPIDDKTLCEAPESEPKLSNVSTKKK